MNITKNIEITSFVHSSSFIFGLMSLIFISLAFISDSDEQSKTEGKLVNKVKFEDYEIEVDSLLDDVYSIVRKEEAIKTADVYFRQKKGLYYGELFIVVHKDKIDSYNELTYRLSNQLNEFFSHKYNSTKKMKFDVTFKTTLDDPLIDEGIDYLDKNVITEKKVNQTESEPESTETNNKKDVTERVEGKTEKSVSKLDTTNNETEIQPVDIVEIPDVVSADKKKTSKSNDEENSSTSLRKTKRFGKKVNRQNKKRPF